jgi:hypothetical protein
MDARVLIKHSASKCNKELLQFLKKNVNYLRDRYSMKVIIVYAENIHILKTKIKQLPALIIEGGLFVGNQEIKKRLLSPHRSTIIPQADDLENYWNNVMNSKDQEEESETSIMDAVKAKTLEQTKTRTESLNSKRKQSKRSPSPVIYKGGAETSTISELDDDPYMKQYWENQEYSSDI